MASSNNSNGGPSGKSRSAEYRAWRIANRETLAVKKAAWRKANPEKVAAIAARFRARHKAKIKAEKAAYVKRTAVQREAKRKARFMNDAGFRMVTLIRSRISLAIRRGYGKKSHSTMTLLGCSLPEFRAYFEGLFTPEMSWELFLAGGIHIDHKIPCASFDMSDPEQQRACFHWSNLQPLLAVHNLQKSDRMPCGKSARKLR